MSSVSCRFCAHRNPAGAKFCNECGSPLHLRPCPRCEAITDASAGQCHQCGASLDEPPAGAQSNAMLAAVNEPSPAARAMSSSIPIALAERFDPTYRSPALAAPAAPQPASRANGARSDGRTAEAAAHEAIEHTAAEIPAVHEIAEVDEVSIVDAPAAFHAGANADAPGAHDAESVTDVLSGESDLRGRAYPSSGGKAARRGVVAIVGLALVAAATYFVFPPGGRLTLPGAGESSAGNSSAVTTTPGADDVSRNVTSQAPDNAEAPVPPPPGAGASAGTATAANPPPGTQGPSAEKADAPANASTRPNEPATATPAPSSEPATAAPAPIAEPPRSSAKNARAAKPPSGRRADATATAESLTRAPLSTARPPARNKDAEATQRLIERDLAGFTAPAKPAGNGGTPPAAPK